MWWFCKIKQSHLDISDETNSKFQIQINYYTIKLRSYESSGPLIHEYEIKLYYW